MAEIHVERKRGVGGWLWILLIVIVIVAVGVYLWQAGYIHLFSMGSQATPKLASLNVGGLHGT